MVIVREIALIGAKFTFSALVGIKVIVERLLGDDEQREVDHQQADNP